MKAQPTVTDATDRRIMRRALWASFIGSVVEYYDFLLYGTASAVVFGPLFFADAPPAIALTLSFATLAIGFLVRPLGGIIFGAIGDRSGRKTVLTITLVTMGAASTAIGLLPTYGQVGVVAPVLLIVLRIVQGFAVGGEWGGSVLLSMEHATDRRRGIAASVTQIGAPAGTLLSTGVFALFSLLPSEQFLTWGWRVPFLLSAVLLLVGFWIRRGITETPAFQQAQTVAEPARRPLRETLTSERWKVLAAAGVGAGPFVHNGIMIAFVIAYGPQVGVPSSTALTALVAMSAVMIVALPAFSALSDRVGRRMVTMSAGVLLAGNAFVMFALVNTGQPALFVVAFMVSAVLHSAMYGPMAAFMAEMFPATSRFTGTSLGYQIASVLGGLAPLIATELLQLGGGAPHTGYIALFVAAACIITVITGLIVAETAGRTLRTTSDETPSPDGALTPTRPEAV